MSARPALRTLVRTSRTLTHIRQFSSSPKTQHVDPTEISHFSNLASTWWAPHGPSRLLHLMNPLRLDFLTSILGPKNMKQPNSLSYLDVGCGGGILAETLARLPSTSKVIGLEPAKEVFEVARGHMRMDPGLSGKLEYRNQTLEDFAEQWKSTPSESRKQFSHITLMEVLEHAPNPYSLLNTAFPLLQPGGYLLMSTISRRTTSYITTKLIAEDLLRIVPRGTHDWGKYILPEELVKWAEGRDEVEKGSVRVRGCAFVPGFGWKWVGEVRKEKGWDGWGGGELGNYFVAVRKRGDAL